VSPLSFDIEKPAFDEFGKVFARRLGRHIGGHRQLSCRQSEATHQSQQNCSSSRIAQQVRGTGQFLVHTTIIALKLFEYYGPRRTIKASRDTTLCLEASTLITLFLRYTIAPNKLSDIAKYITDEQIPIRESGGEILGYFMPTDFAGATNEAIGLIDFPSLAEYEVYRAKLAAHPLHKKYVEVLESTGSLLSIHRSIVQRVESSPELRP
jgi:NIPSNAP